MKKVLVSKEDSWKLDTSMFCVNGSWETGYQFDIDIFFMVGVTSYYEVGWYSDWCLQDVWLAGLIDLQIRASLREAKWQMSHCNNLSYHLDKTLELIRAKLN